MDGITITNSYGERFIVRYHTDIVFGPVFRPLNFRNNILDASGFISRFSMDTRSQLKRYLQNHAPSHQAMCYMRPVEEALRAGKLKVYTLGKPVDNADLTAKANPYYDQLKRVLNRIISVEQAQTKALDDIYNQEDTGTKILINMGALFQGAIDFGSSTVEAIKDTAIWAKDVVEVANPHLRAVRLITQLSESSSHPGDIQDKILDFVQKATDRECQELADVIGFDIRKFSVSAIKEALTMAAALFGDSRTYTILFEFGKRFISVQHHTELLRYGVNMVFQIIIGAILFILSGGASVIANIAAIARQVGKLMVELGQILVDLAKLLVKKLKRKKKGSRRHKGGDTSSGSGSSSNTKSQSEKPSENKNNDSKEDKNRKEPELVETKNQHLTSSKNSKGVTFEGSLYRSVPEGRDPLEIHPIFNTQKAKHRYTGQGQGGLYLGSSQRIVNSEFTGNGASIEGLVNNRYEVKIDNLLDLTDPTVRDDLGVSLEDLVRTGGEKEWRYEVTNPLGRYAEDSGYNGIIAPAAQADGGVNVILFEPGLVK